MTVPLEDYAMIGDGESAALIARNGSIDWLCWPRFDSDACLACLLGDKHNGQWLLAPRNAPDNMTRRYREDTLVLETDFSTATGRVRITDFMPMRDEVPTLIRTVEGLGGTVPMTMRLCLRFDYGAVPPWGERCDRRMVARVGPDMMVLHADIPLGGERHDVTAAFDVAEGERLSFVLRYAPSHREPPGTVDSRQALAETESYWRSWIARFDRPTDWPDAVRRSLITLKALINRPTGGIVAAPTTSLPEVPGGQSNWDYRFCWLRDATFTIAALLNAGYHEEATAWRDWILRAIAGAPEHIHIMYRIDGGRHLEERNLPALAGYRWSRPVRVGNSASGQKQLDVYGELIDVFHLAYRAGIERSDQGYTIEQAIVEHLEDIWHEAGHGIWESRGEPRHYVYSKIMSWVAIDRFLRRNNSANDLDPDLLRRMRALRDSIHREVCTEGYDDDIGSFVQFYGSQDPDASLLLIPSVGFLPADDARVVSTVARIESELMDDGLLYRSRNAAEGGQGAFLACNCWLADCRHMQGRKHDARAALERLIDVSNDVGLLSEEYDLRAHRLSGNFPQALSHLALVTSALGLCGPVLQRGGG